LAQAVNTNLENGRGRARRRVGKPESNQVDFGLPQYIIETDKAMAVKAFIETSLLDWDGRIVMVLFFGRCDFACPFCQNWELVREPESRPDVTWETVQEKLTSRREWIDGVVMSGGEPLADYPELRSMCEKVKQLGLAVKLDTNGGQPDRLKAMLATGLIDYVAMDIKAPLDHRYRAAAGRDVDLGRIKESIALLREGRLEHEFRTTLVPTIVGLDSIEPMARAIQGARLYALQQFAPQQACAVEYRSLTPYTKETALALADLARPFVQEVKLRGF
jgi:pyruvate formate lyase activating enzyme